MIKLKKKIKGKILDIGGGGEGIIGRLYQNQVIAIDNRQEELDEAPDGFEKRLMDACCLDFEDESFDAVTAFYSLMFMSMDIREKAAEEMVRVLKKGGEIFIWDTFVSNAEKEPFCVNLDIDLPEERIAVTYGVIGDGFEQSFEGTLNLFEKFGLSCIESSEKDAKFFIRFLK